MSNPKRRFALKAMAMFLLVTFVGQIVQPTAVFALTGGPSQPEITQFQQVSASDMVDLFTGDFSYNIPLFEVPGPNGGYPFNLAYQSAPSMDQEASWVGLGWNISPGAIVRNMRALPDDFDGQLIHREVDMKPNITIGVGANVNLEILSADFKKVGALGLGLRVYYNNYKGVGYTFQPGVSFNLTSSCHKNTVGMGFNFSFDTQDGGIGANMDLTYAWEKRSRPENKGDAKIGIGYNTNSGINATYSYTANSFKKDKEGIYQLKGSGGGSSISFAYPSVSPSNGLQMSGGNFTGSLSFGFDPTAISGVQHNYAGFSFFIDATDIANKNESLKSYGYLNYQNKNDESALVDFNREKDNVFKEKSTTNLHSTSLTYDYYMINGQGTGGMFRPYRNEVGYVHEQSRMSGSGGGSLGFNIPTDVKKFGVNVGFNFSDARSGRWDEVQNDLSCDQAYPDNFGYFRGKQHGDNMDYEGPYFKMNGSSSVINQSNFYDLGGEEAVRFYINDNLNENIVRKKLINKYGSWTNPHNISTPDDISPERRPRSQNVTPMYNRLLTSTAGVESVNEMQVKYYDSMNNLGTFVGGLSPNANSYSSRLNTTTPSGLEDKRESHIGGFIVTNPDGNRYVYGLPAYNLETKEHVYTSIPDNYGVCQTHKSVVPVDVGYGGVKYKYRGYHVNVDPDDKKYDITDQFKSITTTPSYTHSHLLSSILGTDYVDSDNTPGPSDDDYGYWVKFTYVKTSPEYRWRSPFTGASYNAGSEASYEDDKINYTTGTKEIWYVATVETKTHVAIFEMSERMDAKGAAADINNFHPSGSHMDQTNDGKQYKLDKIKLFAKEEYLTQGANAIPIQTIHFEYDYSLCPGVPNNSGAPDYNKDVLENNITTGVPNGGNINFGVDDPNSSNPNDKLFGKLTLKAVYFTYKNDYTGKNHKYKFNYTSNKNYEYKNNRYDRWGTYSWYTDQGQCANADFSYTNQFPQHPFPSVSNPDLIPNPFNFAPGASSYEEQQDRFQDETNSATSAWCLNKIDLPSGGSINVEYESDDYAYVQHQEATQMFKITSFGLGTDPVDPTAPMNDRLYDETLPIMDIGSADNDIGACKRKRKVFFKLEEPIKVDPSMTAPELYRKIYNDYIHPLRRGNEYQVYINTRVNLIGGVYEDIPSYYNLDINPATVNSIINLQTLPLPGDGYGGGAACNAAEMPFGVSQHTQAIYGGTDQYYTHGYVLLANTQLSNFDPDLATKFHPIAVNAWYHMKENLPKLLYSMSNDIDPGDEDYERIIRGGSLLSIIPQISAMFSGFPQYCRITNRFGFKVDLNSSWIKLATPDGKKYGGGCRVKKLYMQDDNQWTQDSQTDQIGQIYDYTIEEDKFNDITGEHVVKRISSGVASYEPIIGGEENALKFVKFYEKDIPLKSSNQTYFEGPYNESYFPAPQVGYRKVTVSSLPTNLLRKLDATTPPVNSSSIEGIRATGMTVNEFYTAKDFPTISQETDLHRQTVVEAIVPIPFIGTITDKQAMGSQGYVIRLNDMHGKPKAVTSFGIKSDGKLSGIPTSKVEYFYKAKPIVYEGKSVFELVNEVDVLSDDPNMRGGFIFTSEEGPGNPGADDYEALIESKTLGLDYEFFYDMRQSYVKSGQGGLDFNVDVLGFGPFSLPIPLPWPSYSQSYAKINTIVANKIIQKTAIVDRVVATDGQSTVTTQNLVFDPITGAPLLTMVNNNFNEPVYNYSIPGRFMYSGMGAAYTNDGLEFSYTASSGIVTIDAANKTIEVADNLAHNIYKNSVTGGGNISLSVLLPMLHEGDEFIVEPLTGSQPKARAYLLTGLNGSQLDCGESGPPPINKLKFYIHTTAPLNYLATSGSSFKFTLVRSGKRNLLANNIGSVVSLNTKDDVFKVDPNDPNYPTAQALIAHSPLKNRFVQELSTSNESFQYGSHVAAWLNSILIPRPVNLGYQIPLGMYSNSVLPPVLADKIDYIIIDNSPVPEMGDACLTCPVYSNEDGSFASGYSILIKIKIDFGGTCIYQPCFARKFNDHGGVHAIILNSFDSFGETPCGIVAYYQNGNDEGSSNPNPFHTTGIPSSAPEGTKSYTMTCPTTCPTLNLSPSLFRLRNILQASAYLPTDIWGELDADMYATGKKGIWRPSINYYYKDERFQAFDHTVHLAGDGVFGGNLLKGEHDKSFYLFNWLASTNHPLPVEWILNNQITQYNLNGVAIETKDILDIYNATIFDRNTNLPVAIADNTKRQEMLSFNFDNNDFPGVVGTIDPNYAFTGKKSLKVSGSDFMITMNFNDEFKLEENKSYLVSAWTGGYNMTKAPKLLDQDHPNQMNIKIEFLGAGGSVQIKPSGFIYEGTNNTYWRRLEGSFEVPVGTTGIKVTFLQRDGGYSSVFGNIDNAAYFDDIRMHPAKSIMKTFVYDEVDFRLKAELDENNYPMYYGYDPSGQLTVVKVLTENGIKTIKEAYSNTKRN